MLERAAQIRGDRWLAVELTLADAPALQAFFEANPEYSEDYFGRPWPADAGLRELSDRPPAEWPQGESRHWVAIERGTGRWLAMLAFVEDLLAPHVWHVGWLLVDRRQRGSGLAGEIYSAWEAHAVRCGARSVRLGVVVGNARAESFWKRQGFVETRLRPDTPYGALTQTMRVQVKPVGGGTLDEHLRKVERDRPEG